MDLMSHSICSQCGFSHPPLKVGEKCPMAKEKAPSGQLINFDNFFASLKNILTSQIQQKKINPDKFLANVLVHMTKYTEEYKE